MLDSLATQVKIESISSIFAVDGARPCDIQVMMSFPSTYFGYVFGICDEHIYIIPKITLGEFDNI